MEDRPREALKLQLGNSDPSVRLQAALSAGTFPQPGYVDVLVERCAVEADFFVRDMLTWALTRHPADLTVPRLADETTSDVPQARSQALHTLSKVGDPRGWSAVTASVLQDADESVARAAWRAGVILVPLGGEEELARVLATQLGRGDRDAQLSLARALAELGDHAAPALEAARSHASAGVRAHALAIERLIEDPEDYFDSAIFEAMRLVGRPTEADDQDDVPEYKAACQLGDISLTIVHEFHQEDIMGNSFPAGGFNIGNLGSTADGMWQAMEQLRATFEKKAGSGTRMGKGDVRAAVIALLAEQPMHGYQIIREIEERSGGTWKPSAGSVYPTLQLLADEGLISAEESNGRKTYALTEAGMQVVATDGTSTPWSTTDAKEEAPGFTALPKAGIELAQAAAQVGRTGTPEQVQQAVAVLDEARRRLYSILAQD